MRRPLLSTVLSAAIAHVVLACAGDAAPPPPAVPKAAPVDAGATPPAAASAAGPGSAASATTGARDGADAGEPPASAASAPVGGETATATRAAGSPKPMTANDLAGDAGGVSEFKVGGGHAALSGSSRKLIDVQPILDRNLPAVARCYASAKRRNPALKGVLNVRLTIEPDGTVTDAADAGGSAVTDADLVNCVFGTYKKVKLGKVSAKARETAVFPLVFDPESDTY